MISALEHPEEVKRLKALQDLNILDSLPEKEFQDIVELASYICKTPISLLSLIDAKRQWFKSSVGLNAKETPRDFAFCAHAILQNEIFEIPDATADARFHDNPLTTGAPHVVFYAGIPVRFDEMPIGTLCVIDNTPRRLSDEQRVYLRKLADQLSLLLKMRAQNQQMTIFNEALTFYKTAIDNMSDGVVLQDAKGNISSFNQSALDVLGLSKEQILGKTSLDPLWRCIHEDGSEFPGQDHPAMVALRTGRSVRDVLMGVQSSGSVRWLNVRAQPIFGEKSSTPHAVVATFTDITEQRKNQSLLIQAAKMTSLGEMASGIAHEINTPLSIIILNGELALKEIDENPHPDLKSIRKRIDKMGATANRIGVIVRGLKTFARDAKGDPKQTVELFTILEEGMSFCLEKFKIHGVDVQMLCEKGIWVSCVPTRLAQVILNLASNAFDAVSSLPEKWVRISAKKMGKTVLLRVTDSGSGISEKVQQKMMTPFFTTKEVGKGTGLGLSISKSIVEELGGKFYYELYQGHTSFLIEMPVAEEPVASQLSKGVA